MANQKEVLLFCLASYLFFIAWDSQSSWKRPFHLLTVKTTMSSLKKTKQTNIHTHTRTHKPLVVAHSTSSLPLIHSYYIYMKYSLLRAWSLDGQLNTDWVIHTVLGNKVNNPQTESTSGCSSTKDPWHSVSLYFCSELTVFPHPSNQSYSLVISCFRKWQTEQAEKTLYILD